MAPGTTAGVELDFLTCNLPAIIRSQRSLARASVCRHLSHAPFGPQRPCATPFWSFLFKAFEAAIWHPCSFHENFWPQHRVFTAVQGCRLAGFKTHKCSPAAPTSLPGSSVWNLFFSLAIWQPSNLYRMGEWANAMVLPTPF